LPRFARANACQTQPRPDLAMACASEWAGGQIGTDRLELCATLGPRFPIASGAPLARLVPSIPGGTIELPSPAQALHAVALAGRNRDRGAHVPDLFRSKGRPAFNLLIASAAARTAWSSRPGSPSGTLPQAQFTRKRIQIFSAQKSQHRFALRLCRPTTTFQFNCLSLHLGHSFLDSLSQNRVQRNRRAGTPAVSSHSHSPKCSGLD
jgi:hypothetical protein